MNKPVLAIIGKPNVGKSTFFNRVAGRKISIVKDIAGVTRDRIYVDTEWSGYAFSMIDTGGIDPSLDDEWQKYIMAQAQLAIDIADVIVMMVDGKDGITPSDENVAQLLRRSKKPIVLAVNKLENDEHGMGVIDFYKLGLGEPIQMSSEHGLGVAEVLDSVVAKFKNKIDPVDYEKKTQIAVIGRPNAGKSSITNRILGESRVVVSDIAGTTRDAIDVPFKYNGKDYVIIDTAGIRRKNKIDYETIEGYSVMRSLQAIRRADVVLYVLDANDEITEQDVRVMGYIHEQGKPSVVVYNKWDLVEKDDKTTNRYTAKLQEDLKFMDYFVVVYVSTLEGTRFGKIMQSVEQVLANAQTRITTGLLNEILQDAMSTAEPPTSAGKRLRIKYITQIDVCPPTFALFVNDAKLLHFSYKRYLENCLRRAKDFKGTPIRLLVRETKKKEKK